jgi:hypothetical protein
MDWGKGQGLVVLGLCLAACGCGSSSASSAAGSSGAGQSLAAVNGCLVKAGFAITTVPANLIGPNDEENRGPGETGELLVGPKGMPPKIGGEKPALVVVSSWKSTAAARAQVHLVVSDKLFAEAFGTLTVQPDGASPTQFRRIQACAR